MLEVIMKKVNKEEKIVVTSLDVAETFEKRHDHVVRDIENVLKSLPENGETYFYKLTYINEQNKQEYPMYFMNRDGFTLLVMGYTGEKAMKFKLAYIKQFNNMEKLLHSKFIERQKGITVRHIVTDMIKQSQENERMHGHAYSIYTDLIYRCLFGKSAKQLREEFGINKTDNLRDCFSVEELEKVQSVEMIVSGLVNCDWGYDEVKNFIMNPARRLIAA